MEKYCILVFIICISTQIKAQEWTKKDSIWLKKILSGEEKLQLNDETKKAIESGTLLSPDPYIKEQMKMGQAELPIMKSFEGITAPESRRNKNLQELPPPVYKLYGMDQKDSLPEIKRNATFYGEKISEFKTLEKLTPRKATVDDKSTLRYGSTGFSAEDILRTMFWPSHRAKRRNNKKANSWKSYNNGY